MKIYITKYPFTQKSSQAPPLRPNGNLGFWESGEDMAFIASETQVHYLFAVSMILRPFLKFQIPTKLILKIKLIMKYLVCLL